MTLRRILVLYLLAALVLGQALGFAHGIVHGPLAHEAHELEEEEEGAHSDGHGHSWLEALFGHRQDDSSCRLLDALGQDAPAACAGSLAVLAPPAVLLATLHGVFMARWVALFDARGPPVSR